ncbi:MAG: hypothetical protein HKN47_09410 [Pirellulaceae bacterium]|nr:hypothetical protein [Pirellulaceae bacterium]
MRMISALLFCGIIVSTCQAHQFELIDETGRVSATVDILPGRLVVHEMSGQRTYFSREPRFDSLDGHRVGYLHERRNQALRFPRAGLGVIEVADLNQPHPRFRPTQRRTRPAARRADEEDHLSPGVVWPGRIWGPLAQGTDGFFHGTYPMPEYLPPNRYGYPPPQSILLDSRTVANPPLPPATLELTNSGPRELRVTVADLQREQATRNLAIRPRQSVAVNVQRDAGAKLVQTYRTITPIGEAITREVVTSIPPRVRYEIIAHEWAMQSIAIDRTGKSPNVIEDINFQGRGLGRFPLPPGDQLQSGQLDVYVAAKQAGNRGAVAPITATENQPEGNASALERAILEAQRQAQQRP